MPVVKEQLPNAHGGVSNVSVMGDEGTLVIFTSSSCETSRAWEETILDLADQYNQKLVMPLLVEVGGPTQTAEDALERMKEMVGERGWRSRYVFDEDAALAREFGVQTVPMAFVFGRGGLVYRGAIGSDPAATSDLHLKNALDAMLARESVSYPETNVEGCAVQLPD